MKDVRDISSHDVATLVPHTSVARFLTGILSMTPNAIAATGAIPLGHALVSHGRAPVFLAIELGAQAAAAFEAITRAQRPDAVAGPRVGSLVRIREAHFHQASVPADTEISVAAELMGAAPPLAIYRLTATIEDTVVLTAVISTHAGPAGGIA